MVITPPQPELAHLDEAYRGICVAFDRGELTASEAREQVLALSHVDDQGRVWRVDTAKSGRHAAFRYEFAGGESTHVAALTTHPNPDLAHLDHAYRSICKQFDDGEITATEARTQVLSLAHVDDEGRTWRIDAKHSGRRAAFICEMPASLAPETLEVEQPDDQYDDEPSVTRAPAPVDTRRLLVSVAALGTAVVLIVVGVRFVISETWSAVSGDSEASIVIDASPGQTVVTAPPVTAPAGPAPKIEAYGSRDEVPFNVDVEFGRSVLDQPLIVHRRGVAGAPRALIVGTIHGDEPAGLQVTEILRTIALDQPIDLWIVDNLNPDGMDVTTRQNANKVDLNRNFPRRWEPVGKVGFWQYSGPSAASEPETRAMMRLGELINPQFTVWYHQDYFRISPGAGRDGQIRERYASLVDLPLLPISGGSYSGTSNVWARSVDTEDGISLTVEFGPSPLRQGEAAANASAVLTIMREFFQP
jgi:protein MpaA